MSNAKRSSGTPPNRRPRGVWDASECALLLIDYQDLHDTAVLRLAHAGAVPRTTSAMISEWFRDWKSPLADPARKIFVPYLEQMAALRRVPEYHEPGGVTVEEPA